MAVQPTAVWRVRPSGSNTNGGGYDAGIAGAGTDYSRQNSAQVSGTAGTAAGTAAFSDTVANNFTSAMVGNALWLSGTGLTTGWYFVVGFTDSAHVTLDRSPGTGTTGTWHLGGAWADPWTNMQASSPLVGQNVLNVLGGGTPNPSSYVDDYTLGSSQTNWVVGLVTTGKIIIANDPATPGYKKWPDKSGGMPLINCNSNVFFQTFNSQFVSIQGLWLRQPTSASTLIMGGFRDSDVRGCVFDSKDNVCEVEGLAYGCEVFYSGTPATGGTVHAFQKTHIEACFIHDYPGLGADNCGPIQNSIFARCGNGGFKTGGNSFGPIAYNIFDAITTGIAVEYDNASRLTTQCFANIFTNNTSCLKGPGGTASVNSSIATMIGSQAFWNNTTKYTDFVAAMHDYDTDLPSNPFVNSAIGNYTYA